MSTVTLTTTELKEFAKMAVQEYIQSTGVTDWQSLPDLLTRHEVARLLNVEVRTVDRKIKMNELQTKLVGTRPRITKKSLIKLLNIR